MNYTNKVFSFFVNLHGDASIKFSTETKELLTTGNQVGLMMVGNLL